MKSGKILKNRGLSVGKMLMALLLAIAATIRPAEATSNVVLWDTHSRLKGESAGENRADWKAVPSELFVFEAEPLKAASDPGYYGRAYSFNGDTIVENHSLIAQFCSDKGRVILYSKAGEGTSEASTAAGHKAWEFVPSQFRSQSCKITRCEILRNAADEVVIQAAFAGTGSSATSALFYFGKSDVVEIKPAANMKAVSLLAPIEYGVVPGFVGDDLIFGATDAPAETLALPAENVFVGLLKGEADELVMTWPKGKQQLNLRLAGGQQDNRAIESVDFENDGQSFYLTILSAPGIWHREQLKPDFLEKDVALTWKKPFPAKWKTQLTEAGVRTTFAFRQAKGTVWRGVPGSYNYPAWFDGENAFYHLSKKVPPKGESIIYFLEGQDTPVSVSTPTDIIKATLGRQMSDSILDPTGRKLRTHHRRGGDGVHRACTCGCTEAIQAVFESRQELAKQEYVKEALGDMKFFVECHVERIEEYQRFANDMIQFLKSKASSTPDLKPYLESLQTLAEQIPQEYSVQKENMKTPDYVTELIGKTMTLAGTRSTNNLPAYMELLKAWRGMGGAQDYVVAQCHMITRKLFQEAGYGATTNAKALPVAIEVRGRCRQILRNPDGYEIWDEY